MPEYARQWQVLSSDGKRTYTPRKDCKHIKDKRGQQMDKGSEMQHGGVGSTPSVSERTRPVSAVPAQTVQAALKAGANPEQATDAARAKREEVQAKKDKALGKMRYGFQLAEEPKLAELLVDEPIAVEVKYDVHLAMLIDGRIINRSGRDITNRFPEIEKVDGPAVLLGELIIPDEKGLGDFSGGI